MRNLLKSILIFAAGVMLALAVKIQLFEKPKTIVEIPAVAAAEEPEPSKQSDLLPGAYESRQNAITQAIANVSPAVVGINVTAVQRVQNSFVDDPFFNFFLGGSTQVHKLQSVGSGVIFSADGLVLTNQHVVNDAVSISITIPGGEQFEAKIVGQDYTTDIAVLKIKSIEKRFSYVELGNSDDLIIGEWAIAIGNPFGLFDISAKPIVTVGVISATDQDFGLQSSNNHQQSRLYADMIQTDAAINSGNSGGPLVNCDGQLIGINTFVYSGNAASGTNIGLGFAIPINRIKEIMDDLLEKGQVDRSFWTGIQYDKISWQDAYDLGLKSINGYIITEIEKNSPAEKAGLKFRDVILELNDVKIHYGMDLTDIIKAEDLKQGDYLDLKIFRNSQIYSIKVELAAFPQNYRY